MRPSKHRAAAIIPLGRDSRRGSSSLPEDSPRAIAAALLPKRFARAPNSLSRNRVTSRAGSLPLFGLAPRGVFRASRIAAGAVGSYPTFSPLPAITAGNLRRGEGFPSALPPMRHDNHRRSIFCGTFRECVAQARGANPWRYQARCPDGVRTFLPPAANAAGRSLRHNSQPAITRQIGRAHV